MNASAQSLRDLLDGFAAVGDSQERMIGGLRLDSRRVEPGDLFIAVCGAARDGREYIGEAIDNGAAAIACEPGRAALRDCAAPCFEIADLQQHIGAIAARFFDHPSQRMQVIGVTGTNGKTTCAYLLAQALDRLGQRCALLGTLGAGFIGALRSTPAGLTTDDAIATHRALAALRAQGAAAACIEASSHGLAQGRLNQVAFDTALLTNFSQDHLDYHGSMLRYARAKRKLFRFDTLRCAVLNADDPFGRWLLRDRGGAPALTYGLRSGAVRARGIDARGFDSGARGLGFEVEYQGRAAAVRSPLIGAVNVCNLLAVIAVLLAGGHDLTRIAGVVGECAPPPGRMEWLSAPSARPARVAVVIDYAHTPDALQRALTSLRALGGKRLWAVFGCGGDRDRGKRAQMGAVAETLADRVVLTDDNPRSEDPARITAQIARGMARGARVIHDRRRAIETAIFEAGDGDIVLIAGKGHETTQTLGDYVIAFNDRDIAAAALRAEDAA